MKNFSAVPALLLSAFLGGCSSSFDVQPLPAAAVATKAPASQVALGGVSHGGQNPIAGAHIYMFAAATSGFGAASLSLIQPYSCTPGPGCFPSAQDTLGNYVTTASDGSFYLAAGQYACAAGQQVYLYSLGGDTGNGANSAAGLLASLGECQSGGSFTSVTATVQMNEVSTVAAAYALAGFALDATHVANDATAASHTTAAQVALANTGMETAFAMAANLFNISGNSQAGALSVTPGGTAHGVVPQAKLNTIADALANCVNSQGPSSPGCSSLLSNVRSGGSSSGTAATDTATLAIYIAHNQADAGVISALVNNVPPVNPFLPILTTSPSDLTVSLYYATSGVAAPSAVAIDAAGDAWVLSQTVYPRSAGTVVKYSSVGKLLGNFNTGAYLGNPNGLAVDESGNAWISNAEGSVGEISASGSLTQRITGYGLNGPSGVAIDPYGNVWVANAGDSAITELDSTGAAQAIYANVHFVTPTSIGVDPSGVIWLGDPSALAMDRVASSTGSLLGQFLPSSGAGLGGLKSLAFDSAGTTWAADNFANCLLHLTSAGAYVGGTPFCYTNTRMYEPSGVAVDGAGKVWVANQGGGTLEEFDNSGNTLSPRGFTNASMNGPNGIAVDGAGTVWLTDGNYSTGAVIQFVGLATPVITPLATGARAGEFGVSP